LVFGVHATAGQLAIIHSPVLGSHVVAGGSFWQRQVAGTGRVSGAQAHGLGHVGATQCPSEGSHAAVLTELQQGRSLGFFASSHMHLPGAVLQTGGVQRPVFRLHSAFTTMPQQVVRVRVAESQTHMPAGGSQIGAIQRPVPPSHCALLVVPPQQVMLVGFCASTQSQGPVGQARASHVPVTVLQVRSGLP
jgi:hypothetical protein